jgi:CheY-like chemotaxis protein
MKFFIVDDDPFSRMLYRQHLINLGYKNSSLFDNGSDCIDKIGLEPDLVLLDYDMPVCNGVEVIKRIKRINPHIHLVIVSGVNDVEVALEAKKHGAIDYIIKGESDLEMISNVISIINN